MPSWDEGHRSEEMEAERTRTDRLQVLLPGLIARGVPARHIEAGPVTRVGRLRMADGTTFLVTAAEPGGLARLVRALVDKHPVTVSSWARSADGLEITLSGVPGRHPVRLRLVGPDQPD